MCPREQPKEWFSVQRGVFTEVNSSLPTAESLQSSHKRTTSQTLGSRDGRAVSATGNLSERSHQFRREVARPDVRSTCACGKLKNSVIPVQRFSAEKQDCGRAWQERRKTMFEDERGAVSWACTQLPLFRRVAVFPDLPSLPPCRLAGCS